MANTKEIRVKIKSIKSTQKITRAMEMVSASKMRKAQEAMQASRPYSNKIRDVIINLSKGRLEYEHPYLIERKENNIGFIIISTDRGLCGGLNSILFKELLLKMEDIERKKTKIELCTIGKKAKLFFKRVKANIIASVLNLSAKPHASDVIGLVKIMLDEYDKNNIDKIYLVYNEFVNTMIQKPKIDQLLPITNTESSSKTKSWDYIYEPKPDVLLNSLLKRYVESLVYQGIVENIACEQSARMVSMKNASDNAGEIINEFQLLYNKARQAAITQELSEIVAGAAAV